MLAEKRIAGAGIDVFLREPPPADHPLLCFDNVIASPHTAGITAEALRQMSVMAAQQWIDVLAGKVPPHLVNPQVWPLYARRFEQLTGHAPDPLS
ncbi:NAD(P)-dependent oxidoreductase [Roseomonas cutis]|uniref:NAD(P)-dependent oxidoreductase n=1 Tax=Roseomonas cutis TaxID=2897332 RepID=UPI00351CBD21